MYFVSVEDVTPSDQCRESCPEIHSFWSPLAQCPEHCVPVARNRREISECNSITLKNKIILSDGCESAIMEIKDCLGSCSNYAEFNAEFGKLNKRNEINSCEPASIVTKTIEFNCQGTTMKKNMKMVSIFVINFLREIKENIFK